MAQVVQQGWEYVDIVPEWDVLLSTRTDSFLRDLRRKPLTSFSIATDSRDVHKKLFSGLTPKGQKHLAGEYRGNGPPPLDTYRVFFDGIEGALPHLVLEKMKALKAEVGEGITELDKIEKEASMSDVDFQKSLVAFTCSVFCDFLRIHPYANGNGHAARCIAWSLLGRYRYWPTTWTIHPRMADPKYTDLIRAYRQGKKEQLETFLQQDLLRSAPAKKSP